MILETKDRHSKRPISQEAYDKWRHSAVTRRLFEDLELAFLEQSQGYLTDEYTGIDLITAIAHRDGAAQSIDIVLSWAPAGVEGPNDEDGI